MEVSIFTFIPFPKTSHCLFWLLPGLRGLGAFGSAAWAGCRGRGMGSACSSLSRRGGELSQLFFEDLSSAPAQLGVLVCHCCSRAQQGPFSLQFAARKGKYRGNSVCSACQLFKENSDLSNHEIKSSKISLSHMDTKQHHTPVESRPCCLWCWLSTQLRAKLRFLMPRAWCTPLTLGVIFIAILAGSVLGRLLDYKQMQQKWWRQLISEVHRVLAQYMGNMFNVWKPPSCGTG